MEGAGRVGGGGSETAGQAREKQVVFIDYY